MLPCTSPWMIVFGSSDDIWNVFPQICICLLKSIGFRRFHSFPLPISSFIMVFVEGMLFPHWWCTRKNDPPEVFHLNGLYTFFCKSTMLGSTFDEHIARLRWPAYCCSVFLLLNLPLFSTVFSCLWLIQYPLTVSNAMSRPSWCHSFCFVICWINPLRKPAAVYTFYSTNYFIATFSAVCILDLRESTAQTDPLISLTAILLPVPFIFLTAIVLMRTVINVCAEK